MDDFRLHQPSRNSTPSSNSLGSRQEYFDDRRHMGWQSLSHEESNSSSENEEQRQEYQLCTWPERFDETPEEEEAGQRVMQWNDGFLRSHYNESSIPSPASGACPPWREYNARAAPTTPSATATHNSLERPVITQVKPISRRASKTTDIEEPFMRSNNQVSRDMTRIQLTSPCSNPETSRLYSTFEVPRNPKNFFKFGRVFMALWTEPSGGSESASAESRDSQVGKYGELVDSKVRRFVIVRENRDYCLALAIKTYNGAGVAKEYVQKSDHGIIFTDKKSSLPKRNELPAPGEAGMHAEAIQVYPDPACSLAPMSRIDYGKVYTVFHDTRTLRIGKVVATSKTHLEQQWHNTMIRGCSAGRKSQKAKDTKEERGEDIRSILNRQGGRDLLHLLVEVATAVDFRKPKDMEGVGGPCTSIDESEVLARQQSAQAASLQEQETTDTLVNAIAQHLNTTTMEPTALSRTGLEKVAAVVEFMENSSARYRK